jgi:glycosyltransferase involved in cell wall biosynthesis
MGLMPSLSRVPDPEASFKIWAEQPTFVQLARQVAGLSEETLPACRAQQTEAPGRLVEALRGRGLLSRQHVREILAAQARWTAKALEAVCGRRLFPWPASLSLCLPALNEQDVIESTLDAAVAVLPELVRDFEVIVVDDGSRDQTAAVVARCAEHDPRVRLVRHPRNRGYGASVTTGMRAACGDLISFSDSDGQFTFVDLAQLLARLPGCDVVIGYRHRRADHWMRLVNGHAWNQLIRLVLGVRVRDLDCAMKVFPRHVVERLSLTATGNAINAEIMAQCVRWRLKIRETPVRHFPRCSGTATGNALGVVVRAFQELPSLWKYRSAAARRPALRAPAPAAVVHGNGSHNGSYNGPLNGSHNGSHNGSLNGSHNGTHAGGRPVVASPHGPGTNGRAAAPDYRAFSAHRTARAPRERLRVCMLAACPFPANYGTPGSIREMSEAIADLGHDVHIVTYPMGEDIQVRGPQIHRPSSGAGGRSAVSVGPNIRRPLHDLQMVFKTRAVIRKYRPHVIHAHGYEAVLAGWLANLRTGLPLVCSGHHTMGDELASYDFIRPRALANGLGTLLDAVVPRLADYCLPHSANMDRFFRDMGLAARVGSVVNFGIDLDRLRPGDGRAVRARYGLGDGPVVLYAGLMDEFQRLDLLLEAMGRVVRAVPAAKLLVVVTIPNGKNGEALRRQAEALGIAERVVFTEPRALATMPDLLACCDVAVVPRPHVPGFPIKLLNYMAAQKASVLFASSASHGMVHRHNTFLAAPDTAEALAAGLVEVLRDGDLQRRLGRNGYRYVKEHHDRRRLAEQVVAVYRRLLGDGEPADERPLVLPPFTLRFPGNGEPAPKRNGLPARTPPLAAEIATDAIA